jgi:prolyl-tRNA synthetase
MRYASLFPKTLRETPREASNDSTRLLYQGGFIRESTAGRYFYMPLGMRVKNKMIQVIREEMDKAGAQEMISPVLHPLELWQETNRTSTAGFELMKIKDRRDAEFALGGTAEEMFTDVVRKAQVSYKELPFNIYQFSQKFRDELRARGGLLRVREFLMKDAYSFHADPADFQKEYKNMWRTYEQIFRRFGLDVAVVASDNGYIGGEYCHEFVVESAVGESRFLVSEDGKYAAHEDVAVFLRDDKNLDEPMEDMFEVKAERGRTMEDGVKLHGLPLWRQIKDVMFKDERGRFVLAVIRGDLDVNEVKLAKVVGAHHLEAATEDEIRTRLGSEPGFISPVGIRANLAAGAELVMVCDTSLRTVRNAYGGANKPHTDLMNINIGRDFDPEIEADVALAQEGFLTAEGDQKLVAKKGIEVGNIFQLGHHYSKLMNATFTDAEGKQQHYYMGCYGLGVGRTMATIVEQFHDDKGIVWPKIIAPYQAHLLVLGGDEAVVAAADGLYQTLGDAGIEVLYDDRTDVSAGVKFADADLIGIPYRLVISKKTLAQTQAEVKDRATGAVEMIPLDNLADWLRKQYA